MQQPRRPERPPESAVGHDAEDHGSKHDDVVPERPTSPPTGALPLVDPPTNPPTGALPVTDAPVTPPSTAPDVPPPSRPAPSLAKAPAGPEQGQHEESQAPEPPAPPATGTSDPRSDAFPKRGESSALATAVRTAVLAVPGVAGVGEPVSRVLGRIAQAMGQDSGFGVAVTGGEEDLVVDLGFVARPVRPLRNTAEAVRAAVASVVGAHGRRATEVNIDVLDVAAPNPDSAAPGGANAEAVSPEAPTAQDTATGEPPGPTGLGSDPAAATTPSGSAPTGPGLAASGTVPGHVRISSRALSSTARHLAAATFGTPERRISVTLQDDAGDLALRLNLPLPLTGLRAAPPESTLRTRALKLRTPLRVEFERITGAKLSRVDVLVTGIVTDADGGAA